MYIPVALAIGALTGLLRGGSFKNLAHASFRWPGFLVIGCVLQVAAVVPGLDETSAVLLVASYVSLLIFAVANIAIAGMAIVAVGIALNAFVIAVNDGMPVKAESIVAAGLADSVAEAKQLEFRGKRHLATEDDLFIILGDIIPVPIGRGSVLSYGDLVLAAGVAVLLDVLLRRRTVAPEFPC